MNPKPPSRSAGAPARDRRSTRERALPAGAALAEDSLAYSLLQAAHLVAGVIEGENLTAHYEILLKRHSAWSDSTRGAIRDLAWSTLRAYGRGDAVLRKLMQKEPPAYIRALLLVALYRLEQRPDQAHTLVDQAVEAAADEAPGLKGVVNGVLRNALREGARLGEWRAADPEAMHAYPQWWIRRVRADHPENWETILEQGNQHPPMALRINARRSNVTDVIAELDAANIGARVLDNAAVLLDRPQPVHGLPGFDEGRLSVQDAGAQWAARWLGVADGQRVVDACSAPGGKTAHILELAEVELTALELDPRRAARIKSGLDRLGLRAHVQVADCRDVDAWWDGQAFDRILADVPCSASGVVRRHPDIKWLRRDEDIARFAAQQAEILDALWRTLAPDGTMLYVTCSVFDEENSKQIERFLARHPDAEPSAIDGSAERSLLPTADHDGFYYARLRKIR